MNRRWLAACLLVAAALLFGIGTSIEAAERSEHQDTEADETTRSDDEGERILGIDAASPAVIGVGIVLSFGAAAAIVFVRRRPVDLGVAAFAGLFGVLDLAEAVHGLSEDEVAVGILAPRHRHHAHRRGVVRHHPGTGRWFRSAAHVSGQARA